MLRLMSFSILKFNFLKLDLSSLSIRMAQPKERYEYQGNFFQKTT